MPDEKRMMFYMASGIVALCFVYFFCVTFGTVSAAGMKYADIILGALIGSGFTALISFYFGSSKGSVDKGETIDTQIKNAATVAKDSAKG